MAKTSGPLLSLEASGKLGRALHYARSRKTQYAKKYSQTNKKPTLSQLNQRLIIALINSRWQGFSDADKQQYINLGAQLSPPLPGYNYFVRIAQTDLLTYLGLNALYTFDELPTSTVTDFSGNGFNGTKYPSYPSNAPTQINSINTKFADAITFDGSDDYVDFGDVSFADYGTNPFSLLFWFKRSINGSYPVIMKNDWGTGTNNGFCIYTRAGGAKDLAYYVPPTATSLFQDYNDDTWRHYAITRANLSATGCSVYINGQFSKTFQDGRTLSNNLALRLAHGSEAGYGSFELDNIMFYNRALPASEIASIARINLSMKRRQPILG